MNFIFRTTIATLVALFTLGCTNVESTTGDAVVEIVIFKVSDPAEGLKSARALVEDAKAFNDGIVSAELYQSLSSPNTIAQRIRWKSLEHAKAAQAASSEFENMARVIELTTESVIFDHFAER